MAITFKHGCLQTSFVYIASAMNLREDMSEYAPAIRCQLHAPEPNICLWIALVSFSEPALELSATSQVNFQIWKTGANSNEHDILSVVLHKSQH